MNGQKGSRGLNGLDGSDGDKGDKGDKGQCDSELISKIEKLKEQAKASELRIKHLEEIIYKYQKVF